MQNDVIQAGKVWLAPMAGYSDVSFRAMARSFGWSGLCFTEMLNTASVLMFFRRATKKNNKLKALLEVSEADAPIAYQLYGNAPQEMLEAALLLGEKYGARWIDINMGCPQRKISNRGAGAGLLLNHKLAVSMVALLKEKTNFIISVKLRSGWKENDKSGLQLARELATIGVSAITIHSRTRAQRYSGKADWDIIKEAVEMMQNVLVVGNGDIVSVPTALEMLKKTGCGAVMIGRAALKEPWLLRDLELAIRGNPLPSSPSKYERTTLMIKHFDTFIKRFGEAKAHLLFRRWIPHYAKSLECGKEIMIRWLSLDSSIKLLNQLLLLRDELADE
jgi:nifR3 family TIM-barrel protein